MKSNLHIFFTICTVMWTASLRSQVQQIPIPRIDLMPALPSPLNIRDWKSVANQYDALIYDHTLSGQHLPLIFFRDQGTNYPENMSYGLHSYVGTANPFNGEAINVLPSLVGASLVGIDKTVQFNRNWVLMSQDYFNKKNGELIYLNGPNTTSGNDWWYETMPNIFFFQLNDLYPNVGDANQQFENVANQFTKAVRAMGADDTPWHIPNMNYRAWDFQSMTPNPGGVIQPEAAGAFAWLLYHAYKKTGNPEYLKSAEWSLEFLNQLTNNPSYELQLPYGTYVAAKMNAEIGTAYDIEKMINWSFDRGPLRGWGTIVGNWGGLDVSGLVGEANDQGDDYAFLLNGVQQAAALVPAVRYDKRFSPAIAKWVLNLANATRIFYSAFLPGSFQDGTDWSGLNDPQSSIGHEALKERLNGISPFATGDAINGGWAATNYALYGSSSIGYLGAMIEQTSEEGILKIDLLKTDFYRDKAYPTFLLFNPYLTDKNIPILVGSEIVDVYEALSETFIERSVSGQFALRIPPGETLMIVLTPPDGILEYDQNKMLLDSVVVDYMQTKVPFARPPRIQSLAASPREIVKGDTTTIYAQVIDLDSDVLSYSWRNESGTFLGDSNKVSWIASDQPGEQIISLSISDASGLKDSASLNILVVEKINLLPEIVSLIKGQSFVEPEETVMFTCIAQDGNGDTLTYSWTSSAGAFTGSGNEVTWTSPPDEGLYQINVLVEDPKGGSDMADISIFVKYFESYDGALIASYPFEVDARDTSGNDLHGVVAGAKLTTGPGEPGNKGYFFDGINDNILVKNESVLNFQDGITLTLWFNAHQLKDDEIFLVSHGSWQNRWKLSIIPERLIRWTINTEEGPIGDLDSDLILQADSFYHIAATYDGTWMILYINGQLHTVKPLTGKIRQTMIDLMIAQMLPDNNTYNFRGIIDQVNIYDHALSPNDVKSVFEENMTTPIHDQDVASKAIHIQISPNPVADRMFVTLSNLAKGVLEYAILQLDGKIIRYGNIPNQSINQTQFEVQMGNVPSGTYFLKVKTNNGVFVKKLVKM